MKLNVNASRVAALCTGLLALLLTASCGGGSQHQNNFRAARVFAFGDEFSVINPDQSKYTVNALQAGSNVAYDCNGNPLWIQTVASAYGLLFPQCPSATVVVADPVSRIYASYGATVADLGSQISQRLNEGGFASGDLATVLVGANDVVAQFQQYPGVGEPQLLATLDAAGTLLAAQVNQLADLGVKVLISTIPDMGLTPFAGDRSAGSTDSNPALLSRLSARFNDAMLAHLENDGHKIGLIQLDEFLQASDRLTQLGAGGSFANTTLAACTVPLPQCTTNTLIPDAITANYLWADSRHLGASGQSSLGSLALTRAFNNPF